MDTPHKRPFSYQIEGIWRNAHLQTVSQTLFRKVVSPIFERESIRTADGDHLFLDWIRTGQPRLAIISHGLEGSSDGIYAKGMANLLSLMGWDVLAWNMRGCGGVTNNKIYFYHSGKTEDLLEVVEHAKINYESVSLIGFSIGGNLTLKFLGEFSQTYAQHIRSAACLSVPCDLGSCADMLRQWKNAIYMKRFLRRFSDKLKLKNTSYPKGLSLKGFSSLKNFHQFDARYTAPLSGYRSIEDYWSEASCSQYLDAIRTPTLLVSSYDDPLLGEECYPESSSQHLTTHYTSYGGHVGYWKPGQKLAWYEPLFEKFLSDLSST